MFNYKFNEQKAIELILFFANNLSDASKLKVQKLLFFADIYHINKFGRPILGDIYNALPQGPINSKFLDFINTATTETFKLNKYNLIANRKENLDYFSKSDIEALNYSLQNYGHYTAEELSKISHEHKAWINARNRRCCINNPKMDWLDFLDDENSSNKEFIEQLEENAEFLVF